MSRFLEPLPLFGLAAVGTAALLGSAVLVANSFQQPARGAAEGAGLVGAAWAQDAAAPAAEEAPSAGEEPAPAADAAPEAGTGAAATEVAATGEAGPDEAPHGAAATGEAGSVTAADTVPGIAPVVLAEAPAPSREGGFGLGREALPEEIAAWDIDVRPDGQGLPEGSGDVWTGEELFVERCASCHGDFGEGAGRWPQLAGGFGTLDGDDPVKTVGSFWPYLSTAVDYIHRAMPFGDAQSLTPDETYAITAYVLHLNDLVDDDFVLSPETFASVRMPNADGFFEDDRDAVELVEFSGEPCMEACKESVEITMRATVLDVTPGDGFDVADAADAAVAVAEEPAMAEAVGGTNTTEAEATQAEALDTTPPATEPEAQPEAAAAPADASVEAPAQSPSEAPAATEAAGGAPDMALVAAGEQVFRRCSSCHEVGEGARTRTGPVLNGVVGAPIASEAGFRYSRVLEEAGAAGRVWSVEELSAYLADPRGHMPGTKMAFQGLRSADEIAAVIAFLQSHPE
jgi:cytochrome c2